MHKLVTEEEQLKDLKKEYNDIHLKMQCLNKKSYEYKQLDKKKKLIGSEIMGLQHRLMK